MAARVGVKSTPISAVDGIFAVRREQPRSRHQANLLPIRCSGTGAFQALTRGCRVVLAFVFRLVVTLSVGAGIIQACPFRGAEGKVPTVRRDIGEKAGGRTRSINNSGFLEQHIDWLIYLFIYFFDLLIDWLIEWLIDWLIHWLVDWLIKNKNVFYVYTGYHVRIAKTVTYVLYIESKFAISNKSNGTLCSVSVWY